jgi:predicted DNA-binding transcriptional regulator AlpA
MQFNEFTRLVQGRARRRRHPKQEDRFVGFSELAGLGIPYTRVHLRRLIMKKLFPAPVQLSANRIAWRMSELAAWKASRPAAPTPKDAAWEARLTNADSARGAETETI